MKRVFNLIIVDESGSMCVIEKQALMGLNETIETVKKMQGLHKDMEQRVTLITFDSSHKRYVFDNVPARATHKLTNKDYRPGGATPLYDAIGMTLSDLEAVAATHEDATAVVTIITDGYENSSTEYTGPKVAKMIEALKEKGWTFNFIGANIDVEKVSATLKIDNTMSWNSDEEGTKEMYSKFRSSYTTHMAEMVNEDAAIPLATRIEERKKRSRRFFGK